MPSKEGQRLFDFIQKSAGRKILRKLKARTNYSAFLSILLNEDRYPPRLASKSLMVLFGVQVSPWLVVQWRRSVRPVELQELVEMGAKYGSPLRLVCP